MVGICAAMLRNWLPVDDAGRDYLVYYGRSVDITVTADVGGFRSCEHAPKDPGGILRAGDWPGDHRNNLRRQNSLKHRGRAGQHEGNRATGRHGGVRRKPAAIPRGHPYPGYYRHDPDIVDHR